MARSCFQRARTAGYPKTGATLRKLGRDYLMKATKITSVSEPQQPKPSANVRAMNDVA